MTVTEPKRHPNSIQLYSGRYVQPLDLQPEDVTLEDVGHHLSNVCRFSGACRLNYSVAQHSVLVAHWLQEQGESVDVVLRGLFHDASEYVLGDMNRQLKHHPEFGALYRAAEEKAMAAIVVAFDLMPEQPPIVKLADNTCLVAERRDLMPKDDLTDEEWGIKDAPPGLNFPVVALAHPVAERLFCDVALALFNERALERREEGS